MFSYLQACRWLSKAAAPFCFLASHVQGFALPSLYVRTPSVASPEAPGCGLRGGRKATCCEGRGQCSGRQRVRTIPPAVVMLDYVSLTPLTAPLHSKQ